MPIPSPLSVEPLTFQQNAQGDYIEAAPGDVAPYPMGWLDVIQYPAEYISSVSWSLPAGVIGTSPASMPGSMPAIVGPVTTEWLSGTLPGTYEIGCTIVTNEGRVKTKNFQLIIAANL